MCNFVVYISFLFNTKINIDDVSVKSKKVFFCKQKRLFILLTLTSY